MTAPPDPALSGEQGGRRKWALLIGVNKYRHARPPLFPRLRGCVADVGDLRATLIGCHGFDPSCIRVLLDEEATRGRILEAIQRDLVERAGPDDTALLYFSGHGSECFDPTRINNRDQTLVPFDARDPDDTIADISGTDLNAALRDLRPPATLIVDACFSGSLRARRTGAIRAIPPATRVVPAPSGRGFTDPPRLRSGGEYVLLAACAPNEESGELRLEGRPRGAFTYCLCRELRRAPAGSTYRDVMDRVVPAVASLSPSQHPSLEGSASDNRVLTHDAVRTGFHVQASSESSGRVRLEAGGELGLTVGSTFSVFPPGTHDFDGSVPATATVRIESVHGLTSTAAIVEGGPVEPASRAVEVARVHVQPRIRVSLREKGAPAAWRDIRERLAALPFLDLVPDDPIADVGDDADLRLVVDDDRIELYRPGADSRATRAAFNDTTTGTVTRWLAQWSRWFRLLWLCNERPEAAIDFTVTVRQVAPSSAPVVFCTIRNDSHAAWYLALLNLSDDGAIQLLLSSQDAALLNARRSLERSFELEPIGPGQCRRLEVIKLFATRVRRDFSLFEGGTVREVRPAVDAFDRLLGAVAGGAGRGETPAVMRDWVAINRHFSYGPPPSAGRA